MKPLETFALSFVEDYPKDAAKALEQLDVIQAVGIMDKLSSRLTNF
jgi:hypothetical protein